MILRIFKDRQGQLLDNLEFSNCRFRDVFLPLVKICMSADLQLLCKRYNDYIVILRNYPNELVINWYERYPEKD